MKNAKDFIVKNGHLKKYIGNDADVVIPEGVDVIDIVAFENCKKLMSVSIPEEVTELHPVVFNCCQELTTISLSNSIEKIDGELFSDCPKLSTFILPEGIKNSKAVFWNNYGKTSAKNIIKELSPILF